MDPWTAAALAAEITGAVNTLSAASLPSALSEMVRVNGEGLVRIKLQQAVQSCLSASKTPKLFAGFFGRGNVNAALLACTDLSTALEQELIDLAKISSLAANLTEALGVSVVSPG